MAVPKRQHTKSRRGKRRNDSSKKSSVPNLSKCPKCDKPKLPHVACSNCGFYKDNSTK